MLSNWDYIWGSPEKLDHPIKIYYRMCMSNRNLSSRVWLLHSNIPHISHYRILKARLIGWGLSLLFINSIWNSFVNFPSAYYVHNCFICVLSYPLKWEVVNLVTKQSIIASKAVVFCLFAIFEPMSSCDILYYSGGQAQQLLWWENLAACSVIFLLSYIQIISMPSQEITFSNILHSHTFMLFKNKIMENL